MMDKESFDNMVNAAVFWLKANPNSSIGTTRTADDLDGFCETVEPFCAKGEHFASVLGEVIRHSAFIIEHGREEYDKRMASGSMRRYGGYV